LQQEYVIPFRDQVTRNLKTPFSLGGVIWLGDLTAQCSDDTKHCVCNFYFRSCTASDRCCLHSWASNVSVSGWRMWSSFNWTEWLGL